MGDKVVEIYDCESIENKIKRKELKIDLSEK